MVLNYNKEDIKKITRYKMEKIASPLGLINKSFNSSYKGFERQGIFRSKLGNMNSDINIINSEIKKINLNTIYIKPEYIDIKIKGSGVSLFWDEAYIKSIGETMERLSLFTGGQEQKMKFSSYRDLLDNKIKCINPKSLIFIDYLNKKDQLYLEYKDDMKIYWTDCFDIITGEKLLVPSQKVFFNYNNIENEKFIDIRLSTGTACGETKEQAIINGIYEKIERDAFMLNWIFKIKSTEIIIDNTKNYELKKIIEFYKKNFKGKDEIKIYDISTFENIYTFMVVYRNDRGNVPGISVAASTNLNPEKAVIGCMYELILTYYSSVNLMKSDKDKSYLSLRKDSNNFDPYVQVKEYDNCDSIPIVFKNREDEFIQIIKNRKSERVFYETLKFEELSELIGLSCSLNLYSESKIPNRYYPSAGGRYPLEIYLISLKSDKLEKGIYHFNIIESYLELIEAGDYLENIQKIFRVDYLNNCSCILAISAVFERTISKYGKRGYRYIMLDAGHIGQNLCLVSSYLNLKIVPFGGFYDDLFNNLVGLNSLEESIVYAFGIGK